MYTQYWKLQSKPFEPSLDPQFYFPAEAHQGALLKLRYAIDHQRGAALIAGPAGVGKSWLLHLLAQQLPDSCAPLVRVVFTQFPPQQLLGWLHAELVGATQESPATIEQTVRGIHRALRDNANARRHAVLMLDEAQDLVENRTLETVRQLLNLDHEGRPLFTLLLSGQPALLGALEGMPELDQRLAVKCVLKPFSLDETVGYVLHRLLAAGAQAPIFEHAALEAVHHFSQGIPRRINRLCELALLIGFAEERASITEAHVTAVADELATVAVVA